MEMRMGAIRFFALLCLFLIMASANVFGGGFTFDGIGVKANGMGGAFRDIADDWSAAYYNPAGYYQIQDNQFAFNTAFFHNRYRITPDVFWKGDSGERYETGFFNGQEIANNHGVPHRLQGVVLARFPMFENETVIGFSIYSLYNQNQNWELMQLLPAHDDSAFLPDNQFGIKLDGTAYQLTMATGFMEDKLSVGIGLSLVRADLIYNNISLRNNPLPTPLSDRPHDKIPEFYRNEGDGLGLGFRFGLLYDVTEKMKFAFIYSAVSSIDISGRSRFEFYMGRNPNTLVYITSQQWEELLFMMGEVIEVISDFETTLDLPATVGGGLAYQINDKLTLSLDAEMVFWSKFKGFNFDFSNFEASGGPDIFRNRQVLTDTVYDRAQDMIFTDLTAPIAWRDAGKIMLGANYQATDFLDLRAGFSADQSAVDWDNPGGVTQIPQFFDLGTKYSYSFGFGFNIDVWSLEFATTYTHQPDYATNVNLNQDDDDLMDNITALYGGDNYRTVLGFNYRF